MTSKFGGIAVSTLLIVLVVEGKLQVFSFRDMSPSAHVASAILLIAATLWVSEAVPLFVTSFIVLAMSLVWLVPVMRHEGLTIEESELLSPFFSDVILLFLGGFVLSAALHKYRLDEQLARRVLTQTGGCVHLMLFAIMMVTAFLSMWLSNTATAAMMLAVCLPIAGKLPNDDNARKSILLAVPFAANIGGLGTPIGSPPNAIAMQYMQQAGFAPGFGMWMLVGIPGTLVMIAIAWLVLTTVFRSKTETIRIDDDCLEMQWSGQVVFVVSLSLVTVLGWMTTGLHGFATGTVALLPVIAFFGARILTVGDLRSLSWDVLLMMGGGLCLGKVIAASGLAAWMVGQLPIDDSDCFVLMVIFGCAACVMSSVMSNTATANLLMPVILGLSIENLSPVLVGVAFACTLAMPLPVSTPPNAIAFSSGELTVKNMLLPGVIITMTGLALALTTGHWWWDLVGLF